MSDREYGKKSNKCSTKKNDEGGQEVRSSFYELRDSPTLSDEEKTVQRLEDEATLLVMAGSMHSHDCHR